jgi:hypothetical protein
MTEADMRRDPDIGLCSRHRRLLNYDRGQQLCIEHQAKPKGQVFELRRRRRGY